jgi:hypothetical protein
MPGRNMQLKVQFRHKRAQMEHICVCPQRGWVDHVTAVALVERCGNGNGKGHGTNAFGAFACTEAFF